MSTDAKDGCSHSWTQNSVCMHCGTKVYAVDPRPCSGCASYSRLLSGSICRKHLMGVSADMHVTFKITEGTCFEPL